MDLAQLGLGLEAQPMLAGLEKVDAALAATAAKAEALAGKIKTATASMGQSLKNMGSGGSGATAAAAEQTAQLQKMNFAIEHQARAYESLLGLMRSDEQIARSSAAQRIILNSIFASGATDINEMTVAGAKLLAGLRSETAVTTSLAVAQKGLTESEMQLLDAKVRKSLATKEYTDSVRASIAAETAQTEVTNAQAVADIRDTEAIRSKTAALRAQEIMGRDIIALQRKTNAGMGLSTSTPTLFSPFTQDPKVLAASAAMDKERVAAAQAVQRQLVSQAAEAEKGQLAVHKARLEQQSVEDKAYAAQSAARIQQAVRAITAPSGNRITAETSMFQPAVPQAAPFTVSGIASVDAMRQKIAELRAEEARLTEGFKAGTITQVEHTRGMMGVTNGIKVLEEGSTRARGAFRQMTAAIASATFEITGAVYGIGALALALGSPAIFGMKLQSEIEQTRLALAGVVISMAEINGKAIDLPTAFKIAAAMTDRMVASAVKYGLQLDVIQDSVKAITSSGLGANLKLSQILEIATQMAVIGKNMAIPSQRLAVDIRDIMTGMNVQRTVLGGALGITNEMVKKWRESGTLFQNLSEHIKGFAETLALHSSTLAGVWDQIKTKVQLAFSSTGAFDALKAGLKELSDFIGKIDPITNKFVVSPEALSLINTYWLALKTAWQNLKMLGETVAIFSPVFKALGATFELVSFALRNLAIIIGAVAQGLAALLTGNLAAITRIGAEAKVAFQDNLRDLKDYMNLLRGAKSEMDTLRSALASVPQQKGLKLGFGNVPQYDPLALATGKPQPKPTAPAKADPYESVRDSVGKLFNELTKLQTERKALASGDYTSIAQIEAVKKVSDLLGGLKDKTRAVFEARLAKDFAGQFAAAGIAGGTLESRLVQLITREGQLTEKIRLQNEERRKSKEEFQRIPEDINKIGVVLSALDQAIAESKARLLGKEETDAERLQKKLDALKRDLADALTKNAQIPASVISPFQAEGIQKTNELVSANEKLLAVEKALQSFAQSKAVIEAGQDIIQSQVNMGLINEVKARQKLRDLYAKQTGTLQSLIPVLEQAASLEGIDPKKQAELEAYIQSVKEMVSLGKEQTAVEGMLRGLNDYIGSTADKFTNARNVMTKALGGVEDALVTLVTTGKLSFKSMADSIVADIDRMIIKSQVMPAITNMLGLTVNGQPNAQSGILGAIGGIIGGSDSSKPDGSSAFRALWVTPTGGATGLLGATGATGSSGGIEDLFGSIGKSISGLFSGPATLGTAATLEAGGASLGFASFAVGTNYVPRDMVAKVHQGERIVPAAQNKPGMGGDSNVTVITNVTVPGNTDTRTANQIGAEVGRRVQTAVWRNS